MAALRLLVSAAEDNAEDMLLIGRAQGIIMQERGLPPTQALLELCMPGESVGPLAMLTGEREAREL